MNLRQRKELAARTLGVGTKKVWIDPEHLEEVKEAITREDILRMVRLGYIRVIRTKGQSRHRAREREAQRKKGRRTGHGRRKGSANARKSDKEKWMERIRAQRRLLRELRDKGRISRSVYRKLYRLAKGGMFRSKKHLLLYLGKHHKDLEKETSTEGQG